MRVRVIFGLATLFLITAWFIHLATMPELRRAPEKWQQPVGVELPQRQSRRVPASMGITTTRQQIPTVQERLERHGFSTVVHVVKVQN